MKEKKKSEKISFQYFVFFINLEGIFCSQKKSKEFFPAKNFSEIWQKYFFDTNFFSEIFIFPLNLKKKNLTHIFDKALFLFYGKPQQKHF